MYGSHPDSNLSRPRRWRRAAGVGVAAAIAAIPVETGAMGSDSSDADASITILRALEINQVRDLLFGDIIASPAAGTVTVNPNSGVATTGGVTHLGGGQAALFSVFGETGQSFTVTLPAGPISVISGSDTMTVGTWTSTPVGGDTIPPGGTVDLHVGATLTVGAAQPVGFYQGSFTVSVAYD